MKPDSRFLAAAEVRAETDANGKTYFRGYAAIFNSKSEDLGGFTETVKPRAFDKSLSGADVRCLVNHDASRILGRTKSRTLRLTTDSKGLRFECEAPDASYARDLAVSINRGDIDGCSFRFYVAEGGDTWIKGPDGLIVRELNDIEIDDVSIVTYPAYRATEVSVRSIECRDHFQTQTQEQTPPRPGPGLAHARRRVRLAESLR